MPAYGRDDASLRAGKSAPLRKKELLAFVLGGTAVWALARKKGF